MVGSIMSEATGAVWRFLRQQESQNEPSLILTMQCKNHSAFFSAEYLYKISTVPVVYYMLKDHSISIDQNPCLGNQNFIEV